MSNESKSTESSRAEASVSVTQVLASVLAAVSAAVAASFFGVAGTVIGAALGSSISVVAGALYKQSMDRTRDRIKAVAVDSAVAQRFGLAAPPAVAASGAVAGASGAVAGASGTQTFVPATTMPSRRSPWLQPKRLALSAAAVFAVAMAAITGFELVSGQPIASTVSGSNGSGTSVGGGTVHHPSSAPASANPGSTSTSTSSTRPTATVTVTQTPTNSPAPNSTSSGTSSTTAATTAPSASGIPSVPSTGAAGALSTPTG